MAVRVRVVGGEELRRKLRGLAEAVVQENLALALKAGALPIENAAKAKAPYKTGTLRRSITTEVEVEETRGVASIGPSGAAMPYAAQVEFGGTIRPVKAEMLHWVNEQGEDVFAHSVTQVARPYLRPAWDEKIDEAERKFGAVLEQLIEKVAE